MPVRKRMSYQEFLSKKAIVAEPVGFAPVLPINKKLFDFQRDCVRWALARGRAALFEDCGLGKTPQQLEWAKHVAHHTGKPVLIFAPLAVSQQTKREGEKFGIEVTVCVKQSDVRDGVNVTNYEKMHHFDGAAFGGIVLDESSILKAFDGKTRKALTEFAESIPFRLCCTATPAPNDLIELTNHSEFLDIMSGKEIVAMFFVQDGNTTHAWRLRGHAQNDFWKWMASWSVAVRRPSDLGRNDDRFVLPKLNIVQHKCAALKPMEGYLFPIVANTLDERRQARRDSLSERVEVAAKLANESTDPWVVWCDLNCESTALRKAIPGAVEVTGSDSNEHKEDAMLGFSSGKYRVLVSKPSIAGHGMNWQHCHNVAFVGLSDSYENYYQAIRRCWRFGQTRDVDVHIVTSELEGNVVKNIARKERQADAMFDNIVSHMRGLQMNRAEKSEQKYQHKIESGNGWELHLGDSIEVIKSIPDASVGLSVFSPPFPGMYAYNNTPRDIGNSTSFDSLIDHFGFMFADLLRITKPGRSCCVHLTQGTSFKGRDGHAGLKDFRGRVIANMEKAGWIYYGEVTIDKNPQVKAVRTNDAGLQFKSLATDSARLHVAMADYLIQFRKPGDNANPIRAGISERYGSTGWISQEEWILWARPVWYGADMFPDTGIRETDVLNARAAKDGNDEKHLCPLQLGVIERAVKLWSAPGDTVFSPFAGIGSEGYVSLKHGRKFMGIELKESYWKEAARNLRSAEHFGNTLFNQ